MKRSGAKFVGLWVQLPLAPLIYENLARPYSRAKGERTMPATSQIILENIEILEEEIRELERTGSDTTSAKKRLSELKSTFVAATSTLNEGKSVLKG